MELIVFCHKNEAYLVTAKVAKLVKEIDRAYHSDSMSIEDDEKALEFLKEIKEKYRRLNIGHLLTGDLG